MHAAGVEDEDKIEGDTTKHGHRKPALNAG